MRRTTYHDECNRRAVAMCYTLHEEEMLTRQIKQLESAPPNERNTMLIKNLRSELADLITRNISRY